MRAIPAVTANMDLANAAFYNVNNAVHQKQIYILRLGQQYSFSLVCILFLFIGAPLGSIIRKGDTAIPCWWQSCFICCLSFLPLWARNWLKATPSRMVWCLVALLIALCLLVYISLIRH